MKLQIPPNSYRAIASFMNIFDFREERQMICFTCPDGSPPLESSALLFPPPRITDGRVREEDVYRWIAIVTRTMEQEEVRLTKQSSIVALFLSDNFLEAAQVVMERDRAELPGHLQRRAAPKEDRIRLDGPRVYRDFDRVSEVNN